MGPTWRRQAAELSRRYAMATGLAVTFVLFALIVLPAILRERQPPPLPGPEQPAPPPSGWLDQSEAPPMRGKDLPPIDPSTVMTPNPKLLARGQTLFKQNCVSCHGEDGHGDGPAAASLNPKPRNFTQPNDWKNGYGVAGIFQTISAGIPGTGMAAFDFLLPTDRMALVHYVRSLGAFDHGKGDPAKLAALEKQFRTQPMHIPNRIPVSLAIRKMVREQTGETPIALPPPSDRSAIARLLRRVVADPQRVARTVAATDRREPVDAVARAWVAGSPTNGFFPAVAELTGAEWQTLTGELLGTDPSGQASSKQENTP